MHFTRNEKIAGSVIGALLVATLIVFIILIAKHHTNTDWYVCLDNTCVKCSKNSNVAGCKKQTHKDCTKNCKLPPRPPGPPGPPRPPGPPPPGPPPPGPNPLGPLGWVCNTDPGGTIGTCTQDYPSHVMGASYAKCMRNPNCAPPPAPPGPAPPTLTAHALLNGASVPNLIYNGKMISPKFNVDSNDNIHLTGLPGGVPQIYNHAGVIPLDSNNYKIKAGGGINFFINTVGEPSLSSNDPIFGAAPVWPLVHSGASASPVPLGGAYQLPTPWTLTNSSNSHNVPALDAPACVRALNNDRTGLGARYSELLVSENPTKVAKSCEIWTGSGEDPNAYACKGGDDGGPGIEIMNNQAGDTTLSWLTYLNPGAFNNTHDAAALRSALGEPQTKDRGSDYIGWC
jgi:hypothetical protein